MAIKLWVEYPHPGTNTLAYRPLNSTTTVNDQSGNNIQSTNVGVTFGTYQGVDCGYFDGNSYTYTNSSFTFPAIGTACVWFYYDGASTTSGSVYGQTATNNKIIQNLRVASDSVKAGYWISDTSMSSIQISRAPSGWCMLCRVWNGSRLDLFLYKNGTQYTAYKDSSYISKDETVSNFSIGYEARSSGGYIKYKGGLSNLIIENRMRTEQEVADYYNNTKSIYGL